MISLTSDTPHAIATFGRLGRHPLEDIAFVGETAGARQQALERWEICQKILNAPRKLAAIDSLATQHGMSVSQLKRLYYAWAGESSSGIRYDWETLVNRAKYPKPDVLGLPPAFVTFWKSLVEEHQRNTSGAQARRILMGMLTRWERDPGNPEYAIPGYDSPPKRQAIKGYPVGWSKRNLYHHAPNQYEATLRRQGPKAAANLLPSLHTTRVGLHFGQVIYFDDQVFDTYVNLTGRNSKAMRPLAFAALEALSGSCFEMGFKPQLYNGKDEPRTELSQLDFFWFVMHVLIKHGYNRQGTVLVFEHGTANVDKAGVFDRLIKQATGGAVTVDRSGLFNKAAFKAMLYEGKSSGNFRFKAPIESFFNLIRNWHSALPGATGLNPDMAPEESHGLLLYNNRQLKLLDKLSSDQFLRLQRPVLEWEDFTRIALAINRAIDFDRDHKLEGWDKLKFTGRQYRLALDSEQWMSESDFLSIPPDARAALEHIVRKEGYNRSYRLSRGEVFHSHRSQLTRLPMHQIPLLAPERAWREERVSQSLEFQIADPFIDSEPLIYIAKVENSTGHDVPLKRGETYRCLINIFDPTYMWVADQKGVLLGIAKRFVPPTKVDHEAIIDHLAEISSLRAVESKEVHSRMETTAAIRQRMVQHNAIVAGEAASKEEIAKERKLARAARKITPDEVAAAIPQVAPVISEETLSLDEINRLIGGE